jgi:hypothetical protein
MAYGARYAVSIFFLNLMGFTPYPMPYAVGLAPLCYPFSAMGAETECRLMYLAAVRTFVRRYFPRPGPGFVTQTSTTPAFNNGPPFFNPEQGNKKDRNVVVHSLEICLK